VTSRSSINIGLADIGRGVVTAHTAARVAHRQEC
jgi:hypothetical protein